VGGGVGRGALHGEGFGRGLRVKPNIDEADKKKSE
jgi:hypothetical protein